MSVRYRIDGFSFRVDPIPGHFKQALTDTLFDDLRPRPGAASRDPSRRGCSSASGETDYDLVVQTLPTTHGTSASIKLVNRDTFIKDFGTLGLELEDRVRLMEELRSGFGLALVSSPAFGGGITTAYAVMSFLVQQRTRRAVARVPHPLAPRRRPPGRGGDRARTARGWTRRCARCWPCGPTR